ncbi:MAG: transglutaminase family protein [Paracoccaceae bacterium]
MLYEILVRTFCEYRQSAKGSRHVVRLMPLADPGTQRLVAGSLEMKPGPQERSDRVDFFGNHATEAVFTGAHDEIEMVLRARVERPPVPVPLDMSPPLSRLTAEIEAHRRLFADAPQHFLGVSPMVAPDAAVSAWARRQDLAGSVLEVVAALNRALHRHMTYDPDATEVDTPLAQAFALRRGVCQDYAHIMIAALREIGVPAGYVSGLLRTEPPKGQPRLEGADAMHAWVMAWCGADAGWVEFDPTNDLRVATDHIVVARGRDYSDVAPVKGVLWTAGSQTTRQTVDVIPL